MIQCALLTGPKLSLILYQRGEITKVTLTRKTTPQEIINLGWEVLTKEMGPLGATRFWIYVTRGEGDSVLEFKRTYGEVQFRIRKG